MSTKFEYFLNSEKPNPFERKQKIPGQLADLILIIFLILFFLPVSVQAQEVTITLPGDVPLVMVRIPAGTFMMGSPEGVRQVQEPMLV